MKRHRRQSAFTSSRTPPIGLSPIATRLLLAGEQLLLLAVWDYAARVYALTSAGGRGVELLLSDFSDAIGAAAAILVAAGLGLDLLERRAEHK